MAILEDLPFMVAADDGPDLEILGRVSTLLLGFALYNAAVAAYPHRTIYLRHGAEIKRKHEGQRI